MNATLSAEQAVLEELYDSLANLVRDLDAETLNWRPAINDTNSIAAMISHLVGSTDRWLAAAAGSPPQGNRQVELQAQSTSAELIARIDDGRSGAREWFAKLDGVDPGTRRPEWRPGQNTGGSFSAGWCVQHALIHAGEHWGQIQLTRQLKAG